MGKVRLLENDHRFGVFFSESCEEHSGIMKQNVIAIPYFLTEITLTTRENM